MPANLPPVLLSCFKTLLTPLTEEERRCHQLAVAANFKAFNLSLVHVLNVSTACNALCLKPNAPDAGFIFMCDHHRQDRLVFFWSRYLNGNGFLR